jgi:drug/metabolite transporter (DMT)-like permease
VKLILLVVVLLGAATLFGTRRETPFLRWGVVIALSGVVVLATSALFTMRAVTFGIVLAVAGALVYYYGRFARKETLFVSKPK